MPFKPCFAAFNEKRDILVEAKEDMRCTSDWVSSGAGGRNKNKSGKKNIFTMEGQTTSAGISY